MELSNLIAIVGLVVGLLAQAATAFIYFTRSLEHARAEARSNDATVAAQEQKARHDLANEVQRAINDIRFDARALAAKLENLALDAVRRQDLSVFESRHFQAFDKLDQKFESLAREMRAFMIGDGAAHRARED